MDVKEVFVAPGNSEETFVTVELQKEPRAGGQGLRDTYVAGIAYATVAAETRLV